MNNSDTHPITGSGTGKIFETLKSNPVAAFLAVMLLLAFIVRPRRRKYKRGKVYRRAASNRPQKRKKAKKQKKSSSKKSPRVQSLPLKKRAPHSRMVKGSPEAKEHMARLRAMRKK